MYIKGSVYFKILYIKGRVYCIIGYIKDIEYCKIVYIKDNLYCYKGLWMYVFYYDWFYFDLFLMCILWLW